MPNKSPLKIERVSIDDALQIMHDAVFVDARSANRSPETHSRCGSQFMRP